MTDTVALTTQLVYTPSAVANIVENPVYYVSTAAVTQKISGYLTVPYASSYTLSLSTFASGVALIFIQNLDASNYLSVTLKPYNQSGTTVLQVTAGLPLILGGGVVLASNILLQANTANIQAYYHITGT